MKRDGEGLAPQASERAEEGDDFSATPLEGHPLRVAPSGMSHALPGAQARAAALAATTLFVVAVCVGLFTHATNDPSGALSTLLRLATPTPAATFFAGANSIYFSNGAPWGTLTIDGKRLPSADLTGYGATVSRGVHQLAYQARYFPSLRCTFSAPRAQSDTCPLDTSDSTSQFLQTYPLARAIDLRSTGATLQPDQRRALTQRADAALAAQSLTATIAPGDRYLDDHGQVATASAPLHFTLTLALDTSAPSGNDTTCYQFCPDPSFTSAPAPAGGGWAMRVIVTANWALTDATGRRLTSPGYQAGQPYPSSAPVEVGVQLTPAGWQINALDSLNTQAIETAAGDPVIFQAANGQSGVNGIAYSLAPNPLDGCVMDVDVSGYTARLLWRFGALLTVDGTARHDFPTLPVANAAEQALAARITQQQPPLRDDSILPAGQS
ncbi:MAG TPA: hypothetical protein VID72_07890 [Ktedonobacterales bacterium]